MIQKDIKSEEGLKVSLLKLINPSINFGRDDLEVIYHDEILIIIIDEKGNKKEFKKSEFIELIGLKLDNLEEHKNNNWAKFHHVNVKGNNGHIIVERKLNLTGIKTKLLVNIDFIWQDEHWKIIREVIYSMSLS